LLYSAKLKLKFIIYFEITIKSAMDSVVKTYDDNTPEEKAKIAEEERK
jgi:hypothetical protein